MLPNGDDERDEPEEFDPHSLGPEIPSVDVPSVGESDADAADADEEDDTADAVAAAEIDPETSRLFWTLVFVIKVGLLGSSIGAMFVYFQGRWTLGLQLFGASLLTLAYGAYRYWEYQRDDPAASESGA